MARIRFDKNRQSLCRLFSRSSKLVLHVRTYFLSQLEREYRDEGIGAKGEPDVVAQMGSDRLKGKVLLCVGIDVKDSLCQLHSDSGSLFLRRRPLILVLYSLENKRAKDRIR